MSFGSVCLWVNKDERKQGLTKAEGIISSNYTPTCTCLPMVTLYLTIDLCFRILGVFVAWS